MDADLTSIPLGDLMDDTPFDMIVGEIPESYNTTHCAYLNFVLDDTVSWGDDAYYLNREIGDEDHFYNNRKARPSSSYSVGGIGTVNMGLQNPYFVSVSSNNPIGIEHPIYGQSINANQSFYTAERDYHSDCTIPRISYTDTVTTNFLSANSFDVQCTSYPATYTLFDPEFLPCYTNKAGDYNDSKIDEFEILIYPNPTQRESITIVPQPSSYILWSIDGKLIVPRKMSYDGLVNIRDLKPGLYLIELSYRTQSHFRRIVIK